MTTACWADIAAREYADEQGREVEFEIEVENRAKLMMELGGDHDPFDGGNLGEALGDFGTCDQVNAELGRLLRAGEDAAVGQYLRRVTVKYWTKLARVQAEIDLAAGVEA